MKSRCNSACLGCTWAHNALNGRYCEALSRIVEYEKEPPCGGRNRQNNINEQ